MIEITKLQKTFTRQHSLFYAYVWNDSDMEGLEKFLGIKMVHTLFIGEGKTGRLSVWYDKKLLDNFMDLLKKKVNSDKRYIEKVKNEFYLYWPKLKNYIRNGTENLDELEDFYNTFVKWWSPMAVIFNIPDLNDIDENDKKEAIRIREETERYSDDGDNIFLDFIYNNYPEYEDIKLVISPKEIFKLKERKLNKDEITEIKKRLNGYFILDSHLYTKDKLNGILEKNNIKLEKCKEDNIDEVKGKAAFKGKVTGKARVILYKSDLNKLMSEEILVTEMTSPEYVPFLKKVKGIVTDEGGIVCHASIVSRELKIPCIVGTKVASKVFKTGDLVEVDAEKGIVRRIK
jgi:phosphohistidine swiveling domain-containing protein